MRLAILLLLVFFAEAKSAKQDMRLIDAIKSQDLSTFHALLDQGFDVNKVVEFSNELIKELNK